MQNMFLTADTHFTDKQKDEYRFDLFPFILTNVKKYYLDTVVIAGDLVDQKDNHPARLVNRITEEIKAIAHHARVILLMGNHDFLLTGHPFFEFLKNLKNVDYIERPTQIENTLFLPYSKTPKADWEEYLEHDDRTFKRIIMHQTLNKSIASNGQQMEGELTGRDLKKLFGREVEILSGDIHKPQIVDDILEYVGSPYHVHFGDNFKPRCLVFKGDKRHEVHLKTISKFTFNAKNINELLQLEAPEGSQIKVKVELTASEKVDWFLIKNSIVEYCKSKKYSLEGLELISKEKLEINKNTAKEVEKASFNNPADSVVLFAKHENLSDAILKKGLELVK